MKFLIFTDGSILNNGRAGAIAACAAVLVALNYQGEVVKERVEVAAVPGEQTNIRAELMAAVLGLKTLRGEATVTVITDSEYVQRTAIGHYRRKNHRDLWELVDFYSINHNVTWWWTRGHQDADHLYAKYNNMADEAARSHMRELARLITIAGQ